MIKISKINNGTFTLINKDTETYVTLKIHTVQKGNLEGKRMVSKLIGPDNETSYKGFAFVDDNDNINVWRKCQDKKTLQTAHILRSMAIDGDKSKYADKVDMQLSKRCMRCNRKLTTPQSLEDGIGPLCIKKMLPY